MGEIWEEVRSDTLLDREGSMEVIDGSYKREELIFLCIGYISKVRSIDKSLEILSNYLNWWKEPSCPEEIKRYNDNEPNKINKKYSIQEINDKLPLRWRLIKTPRVCKSLENSLNSITHSSGSDIDCKSIGARPCSCTNIEFRIGGDIFERIREIGEFIDDCDIFSLHLRIKCTYLEKCLDFLWIVDSDTHMIDSYEIVRQEWESEVLKCKNIHNNGENKRKSGDERNLIEESQKRMKNEYLILKEYPKFL